MPLDLLVEHFDPGLFFKSNKEVRDWVISNLDLTNLKQNVTRAELDGMLNKASELGFKQVVVPLANLDSAAETITKNSFQIKTVAVVGYPYGNSTTSKAKAVEAEEAVASGASTVEINVNLSYAKSGKDMVVADISEAVKAVKSRDKKCGVIIESRYVEEDIMKIVYDAVIELGVDYLSISTGTPVFDDEHGDYNGIDTYEKIISNLGKIAIDKSRLGLKVSSGINDNDSLMEALFYCTKAGWPVENIRLGSEAGIDIADNIATTLV